MRYTPRLSRDEGRKAYGKGWAKFRDAWLARFPVCVGVGRPCGKKATVVDHVIPVRVQPELAREPTNLRGLCTSCHNRRTSIEQAVHTNAPLKGCGADGFPTDSSHPFYTGKEAPPPAARTVQSESPADVDYFPGAFPR